MIARSANPQRLNRHEESNNPETPASRCRKISWCELFHRSNAPKLQRSNGFRPIKPSQAW